MTQEFEIIWEPETPDEMLLSVDLPTSTVDRLCQKKFGHTNWARRI